MIPFISSSFSPPDRRKGGGGWISHKWRRWRDGNGLGLGDLLWKQQRKSREQPNKRKGRRNLIIPTLGTHLGYIHFQPKRKRTRGRKTELTRAHQIAWKKWWERQEGRNFQCRPFYSNNQSTSHTPRKKGGRLGEPLSRGGKKPEA